MPGTPQIVENRAVLYFGGYEKADAGRQYKRLTRELARYATTWNVKTDASEPRANSEASALEWTIVTAGPNWQVKTLFRYCAWNDLIAEDFARPDWRSIPAGIIALLDFVFSGTVIRYFTVAWRYGLFFTYALVLVALFAAAAFYVVDRIADLAVPMPWYVQFPVTVAAFWVLMRWPGDRFHTRYMLNDWSFASAIAWGRRRNYTRRIETFAHLVERVAADEEVDEILIVGHSLGAVLAIEALAGALRNRPGLEGAAPRITVMTVGSSLLKVGLHPAAKALRRAIALVLSAQQIAWIDYSSLVDVLNFYRCDPVKVLRLDSPRSPVIRTAKIRAMLGRTIYRRFRYNLLRLHRQFVMGNELRYHYDFYMACCGPMPMRERIANPTLSVDNFAEDGTYLPLACTSDETLRAASGA